MKAVIIGKNGHQEINLNRRKACHEKCLNCSCWDYSEVKNCSQTECPLHRYRSGQGHQNAKERDSAIRTYCLVDCMNGQIGEVTKCPSKKCPLWKYRKGGSGRTIIPPPVDEIVNFGESISLKEDIINQKWGTDQSLRKTVPIRHSFE